MFTTLAIIIFIKPLEQKTALKEDKKMRETIRPVLVVKCTGCPMFTVHPLPLELCRQLEKCPPCRLGQIILEQIIFFNLSSILETVNIPKLYIGNSKHTLALYWKQ